MDDIRELGRAVARLDAWEKASRYNWGYVSKLAEKPVLAVAVAEKPKNPVKGRLMLFAGFEPLRDFQISRRAPDLGVAANLSDFRHWEVIELRSGEVLVQSFRAGFLPADPTPEEAALLAPILRETLGVLMRLEENPDLCGAFASQGKMFARVEGLDGKWRDAPLKVPVGSAPPPEQIALPKARCELAAKLVIDPKVDWQVDFFAVPAFRTDETPSRILYVFGGADATSGKWVFRGKMSVPVPKAGYAVMDDGTAALRHLWESLAAQLLEVIVAAKLVPGTISVRSGRMMRFLRPLGFQLPFKIVQHAKLDALDAAMTKTMEEGKL